MKPKHSRLQCSVNALSSLGSPEVTEVLVKTNMANEFVTCQADRKHDKQETVHFD